MAPGCLLRRAKCLVPRYCCASPEKRSWGGGGGGSNTFILKIQNCSPKIIIIGWGIITDIWLIDELTSKKKNWKSYNWITPLPPPPPPWRHAWGNRNFSFAVEWTHWVLRITFDIDDTVYLIFFMQSNIVWKLMPTFPKRKRILIQHCIQFRQIAIFVARKISIILIWIYF